MERGDCSSLGLEKAQVGFPGKEEPGMFYRCWLRSRTLVALIALKLTCNCCINHGQEHQQHGESVLVGRKQRNNDYCSAGVAPWQLNSQKCPGLRPGSKVWVWPWLWAVQVGNFWPVCPETRRHLALLAGPHSFCRQMLHHKPRCCLCPSPEQTHS